MNDDQKEETPSSPWYKKGLHFSCTQCGKCCTGAPGIVFVSEDEISSMAEFLKIPRDLFKRKYLRKRENRYALVEKKSKNFDCIFLEGKQCSVYSVRPVQCRTFPWWKENLRTEESWKIAAEYCEGISDTAPLISFEEISQQLERD